MNGAIRVLAAIATALFACCTSVSVEHEAAPELATLRAAGYRIAVLPFTVSAPMDDVFADSLGPLGEVIALDASPALPMREQLATALHDDVVAWLQQSDFEVLDPWGVMTQLSHAGLSMKDALDPARTADVARAVGADGVLRGDLHRWNRNYYVLQSLVEVGLRLELVDGQSRRRLFRTDRIEAVGSGLTGGPTGYVSAATEPLAGLRGSHLRTLTRSVTRHAVIDLNGGDLGSQPGPGAPRLAFVALAREHAGPFRAGERVDVVAVGTPEAVVRFDIGRLRTGVPMVQTERITDDRGERATYAGHYIVAAGDEADEVPLTCSIQRGGGRRTVTVRYRWDGTLSLDGSPAR